MAGSGLVHGRGDGRAWGDASLQIVTPAPPVACTTSDGRPGESFFVYSTDFSIICEIAEIHSGGKVRVPHDVTLGLVGNTWQGLQLSIRQGNMSITALAHIITQLAAHGGERKLFERGLLPAVWRLDCQDERRAQWHAPRDGPYGNALTTFPTERVPKEARSEAITYEPVLDYAWCHFGRDLANPAMHLPFRYLLWDFLVRVARGGGNGEQGLGIWPELP